MDNINRKPIKDDTYYNRLIYYIHQYPVQHGIVAIPQDWPFNSYHIMQSDKETLLERRQVLSWWGGKEQFVEFHKLHREINEDEFY